MTSTTLPKIAVVGGTGSLGSGLARLWAMAGYPVVIGSRSKERAEAAAQDLGGSPATVQGDTNREAARTGDIVTVTVPYSSHDSIIDEIKPYVAGKVVVIATVPFIGPKLSVVQLPAAGSPAVVTQRQLGPEVHVVSAFHTVGATKLHGGEKADCDVLVFGDDRMARKRIIALADVVAARGVDGGSLANSIAAETLASVLIAINRRYKVSSAGIRITGLSQSEYSIR